MGRVRSRRDPILSDMRVVVGNGSNDWIPREESRTLTAITQKTGVVSCIAEESAPMSDETGG